MENGIIKWDLLQPEEIEVRAVEINERFAKILLYQNSRCTARAFDKMFGSFGWQMDYKMVGEQVYGTLSVFDESRNVWVSKSDTGDKSDAGDKSCISKDKGQASDILKRCAVRWGFATELYTAPKIKIQCPDKYFYKDKMTMTFSVKSIAYVDRKISRLTIVDRFDNVVFDWAINQTSVPVYTSSDTKICNDNITETKKQVSTPAVSNEEKLIDFKNKMQGKVDGRELNRFFNYYMQMDSKNNNGQSIVANWTGYFNPDKLFQNWINKIKN